VEFTLDRLKFLLEPHPLDLVVLVIVVRDLDEAELLDGHYFTEVEGGMVLEVNGVVVSPSGTVVVELRSPGRVAPGSVVVIGPCADRYDLLAVGAICVDFGYAEPAVGDLSARVDLLHTDGLSLERREVVAYVNIVALGVDLQQFPSSGDLGFAVGVELAVVELPFPVGLVVSVIGVRDLDEAELLDGHSIAEPEGGMVLEVNGGVVSPSGAVVEEFFSPDGLAPASVVVVGLCARDNDLLAVNAICVDFGYAEPAVRFRSHGTVLLHTDGLGLERREGVAYVNIVALGVLLEEVPAEFEGGCICGCICGCFGRELGRGRGRGLGRGRGRGSARCAVSSRALVSRSAGAGVRCGGFLVADAPGFVTGAVAPDLEIVGDEAFGMPIVRDLEHEAGLYESFVLLDRGVASGPSHFVGENILLTRGSGGFGITVDPGPGPAVNVIVDVDGPGPGAASLHIVGLASTEFDLLVVSAFQVAVVGGLELHVELFELMGVGDLDFFGCPGAVASAPVRAADGVEVRARLVAARGGTCAREVRELLDHTILARRAGVAKLLRSACCGVTGVCVANVAFCSKGQG